MACWSTQDWHAPEEVNKGALCRLQGIPAGPVSLQGIPEPRPQHALLLGPARPDKVAVVYGERRNVEVPRQHHRPAGLQQRLHPMLQHLQCMAACWQCVAGS